MFDVIVIGAGPAGSTVSKVLAEKGFHVLLAERLKMPRYKSCSGQLIKKSLDLVQKYYGEPVPEFTMCAPKVNKGMIFTDDKGQTFRFEQGGFNVWRSSFDKWLADKAAEFGAEVRDCTSAISCEEKEGLVTVAFKEKEVYTEQAKYIIDCEGVTGSLKKKLTGHDPKLIHTYQTFNLGSIDLDYQFFHAYLQPELSEYDAWFNVKDNQLVLGVSVKNANKTQYYYEQFIEYMRSTNPKKAGAKKEKLSPLEEIIQKINEEYMGEFTEADRVIVNDLYERMKKDEGVQKAAQTDDRQVYHRSVFPGIFDETAMAAYMENQEAYIQLFQDAKKYHAVQAALDDMLYRDLHDKK